jgi:hypothetical protein
MSGHWICEDCGYDGEHAEWCRCLRPVDDQWKGHMTAEEVRELKAKRAATPNLSRGVCDALDNLDFWDATRRG